MEPAARGTKMRGGGPNKRPHSAGADSSNEERIKSLRHVGVDSARADPGLAASKLDAISQSTIGRLLLVSVMAKQISKSTSDL